MTLVSTKSLVVKVCKNTWRVIGDPKCAKSGRSVADSKQPIRDEFDFSCAERLSDSVVTGDMTVDGGNGDKLKPVSFVCKFAWQQISNLR